eukprot:7879618-Pyramimonas_sp.AAC.1
MGWIHSAVYGGLGLWLDPCRCACGPEREARYTALRTGARAWDWMHSAVYVGLSFGLDTQRSLWGPDLGAGCTALGKGSRDWAGYAVLCIRSWAAVYAGDRMRLVQGLELRAEYKPLFMGPGSWS